MEQEIWKHIPNYENYQVSNLGNVKSLNYNRQKKEVILKPNKSIQGYLFVNIINSKGRKKISIHQLVAICFLNHITCGHKLVVNHINFIKHDNRVENLEIVSNRENSNLKHIKSSSKYIGVSWHNRIKKWHSSISVGKKKFHLGYFINEIEASNAYQEKLKQLNY